MVDLLFGISRIHKAGSHNGIFPIAGSDLVDGRIEPGELFELLLIEKALLLVALRCCLAG